MVESTVFPLRGWPMRRSPGESLHPLIFHRGQILPLFRSILPFRSMFAYTAVRLTGAAS